METHLRYNSLDDNPPVHAVVTDWLACGLRRAGTFPALQFNGVSCSYMELDQQSSQVARHLARLGVERGDRVGLCLDRSIEMVAALIGILKAGAAYVPLDPGYPSERLGMMREDARLSCLLAHAAHAGCFEAGPDTIYVWEEIEADIRAESPDPVTADLDPEDVAYVIFTSGSTGRPKGIAMPHRALSNLIEWQLQRRSFRPGARVLQYSSISFDVSFQEIATTLASAGTLVLVSNEERKDPRRLLRRLVDERINRLFLPYVAMRSMIEAAHVVGTYPESLREVITAGEQLRVDDAVRAFFSKIGDASLDNQYGPSESHVVTAHLLDGDPSGWPSLPPIGCPLANNSVFILDEMMRPVGVGEEGELYLAGRNLAHGYLHREEYTRKVFIPNPLGIPQRPILYKSGDLGAYSEDGTINYLGRKDHQVKIRGHRVEPGEINAAAARFPGVEQCLTRVVVGPEGGTRLATWYVVQKGTAVDPAALRRHLSDALPDYMVPVFMVVIDRIPYSPSGKVDMKALPEPSSADVVFSREDLRYATETEEGLARIWSEVLEIDSIPRSAGFFDLGGDSLRAVTLFLKIQEKFGLEFPLSALIQAPTIERLAALISGEGENNLSSYRSLKMIRKGVEGVTPLFLVHGGQGNILVYNTFAKCLESSQPVYGFQWSGWDGYRGIGSIEDMAKAYKEELMRFYPAGPIRLGGYCIGGSIAIRLAQLLEEEGRAIDGPLLVWDAPNLESGSYHPDEPWGRPKQMRAIEHLKSRLLEKTVISGYTSIETEPDPFRKGMLGILQRLPYMRRLVRLGRGTVRMIPVRYALVRGRKIPMHLREFYCIQTMIPAVKKHSGSLFKGDMLYFRSHGILGRDFGVPGWWDDLYFGFGEYCGGRFDAYILGGLHEHITNISEIGAIVKKVYSAMDEDRIQEGEKE